MTWKELPVEIQEKMLEEQVKQGNEGNENIFIYDLCSGKSSKGFTWGQTLEGDEFWKQILVKGKISIFYEKYPIKTLIQKITRLNLIKAHQEFTCIVWTEKIFELLKSNPLASDDTTIDIPQELIDYININASIDQKVYIESLGIKLAEDKNAFSIMTQGQLRGFSSKFLGDFGALDIGSSSVEDNRPDLTNRCLVVHKDFTVNLIKCSNGKTAIEILKK